LCDASEVEKLEEYQWLKPLWRSGAFPF
jgi:hypothetical protein